MITQEAMRLSVLLRNVTPGKADINTTDRKHLKNSCEVQFANEHNSKDHTLSHLLLINFSPVHKESTPRSWPDKSSIIYFGAAQFKIAKALFIRVFINYAN